VLAFGVKLRILPLPGDDPTAPLALVLPALTVGTALTAVLARQTRAAMIETLGQLYVLAATARGLSRTAVLLGYGLRNALLPGGKGVAGPPHAGYAGLLSPGAWRRDLWSAPDPGRARLFLQQEDHGRNRG
jgi:hypothetical protein